MNKKLLPLIVSLKKLKPKKVEYKEFFLELELPRIIKEDPDDLIIKNKQERGVVYLDLFGDEKI